MRMQSQSLAPLNGLRIQNCHELQQRSQTQLGSGIAVAVAEGGSYSSDSTPSLGTSLCHRCSPKKKKKRKQSLLHHIQMPKGKLYYLLMIQKRDSFGYNNYIRKYFQVAFRAHHYIKCSNIHLYFLLPKD